jgi:hypothetical protein
MPKTGKWQFSSIRAASSGEHRPARITSLKERGRSLRAVLVESGEGGSDSAIAFVFSLLMALSRVNLQVKLGWLMDLYRTERGGVYARLASGVVWMELAIRRGFYKLAGHHYTLPNELNVIGVFF